MKSKKIFLWVIFSTFILSLIVIFGSQYISKIFEDLIFRLLIGGSIFFTILIISLLIILLKMRGSQESFDNDDEKKDLEKELKKNINKKINDLNYKFNNAIKTVKKSSLYRFKSNYELPWYLVMGENNEGKTTFIESSGLNFPINYENEYMNEENDDFKWYFAEHAIFIDLSGNFIELKEKSLDLIIWDYFLKFFTKKRWKRPINGIILSISVDTLLSKNNKQLEYLAKNFRDRFDELSKAFMSSIPIYLVITKSDKIDGFKEYFSSLNQNDKNEILGVTFNNDKIDDKIIKSEFEKLLKRLNSSVIDKVHFEWDTKSKGKIFLFTDSISEILNKITIFSELCFTQTRYRKSLMLRGVYFTSVIEEDNSFFIKNLLSDMIFPESEISKIDDNYRKKIKRNQIITFLSSIIVISVMSFFMVNTFVETNDKLIKLERNYQKYLDKRIMITPLNSFSEIIDLFDLLETIKIDKQNITTNNFLNSLFYKFENKNVELETIYYQDLLNLFLPKVIGQIESDIRRDLKDFDKTWDSTKAYLMIEILEKRENIYLEKYMSKSWGREYYNEKNLRNKLEYHWKNLLNYGFPSYSNDKILLKMARNKLVDSNPETITYKDWKNKLSILNTKDFSFAGMLENNGNLFSGTDYVVPSLFTKEGYETVLKEGKKAFNDILMNNWIIGKKTNFSDSEKDDYYNRIIEMYFSEYRKYWNEAISKLNLLTYNDIGALNNQLSILSSPDTPILLILKSIKENTEIFTPTEKIQINLKGNNSLTANAVEKLPSEQLNIIDVKSVKNLRNSFKIYNDLLDDNYQPKGVLASLISEFNKTYQTMSLLNSSVNLEEDAFKIVKDRIYGKSFPMMVQLNLVPIQIKRWYEMVIESNWRFVIISAKFHIEQKYKSELMHYYNEKLKDKYPFNRKNNNDSVKLDDFYDFFKKNGILEQFYNKYITYFVDINFETSTFNLKNIDGLSLNISNEFIENIIKAEKIRKIFFKNDGTLSISSTIKPYDLGNNVATMEFIYDGYTMYYEHGPILTKKIFWPAQSLNNSIKYNLYDLSNKIVVENYLEDNDWSLFKFIDKSELNRNTNNSLIVSFEKDNFRSSILFEGPITLLFGNNNLLNFNLKDQI